MNQEQSGIHTPHSQESGIITCPNCRDTDMTACEGFWSTTDLFEKFSIAVTVYLFASLGVAAVGWLFRSTDTFTTLPFGFSACLWIVFGVFSFAPARKLVAWLSGERRRNECIEVWHVQCCYCHRKYHIVRPLGATPPVLVQFAEEDAYSDEDLD